VTHASARGPLPVPRPAPPFWHGVARVLDLSLGQMLWSRRTLFMAVVLGAPILVAAVTRIVDESGIAPLRVNGQRVGGATIFGIMVWWLYLRFIVPMLGVFYGTSLIADEVEDKTLTYLFTRPVPRRAVLLGKYLAYLVCTTLVVLPSLVIVFFLIVPLRDIGPSFGMLATDLGLLALGLAVYGSLFALVGTVTKRPLLAGLLFAFGWEQIAMVMPGYVSRFTIVYYLQGLVPHAIPSDGIGSLLATVFTDTPGAWACVIWLGAALVVSLVLAMAAVERREYVLGQ
jgi:ABC-type transport system involved in multi-copper enzyme maturation permease subunit